MRNRGNGKGGGIAAVGLTARQMGVSPSQLEEDYLFQIAYLDDKAQSEVEGSYIFPYFEVHQCYRVPSLDDYRQIGLAVKPPAVWRYFCRVKEDILGRFIEENKLFGIELRRVEDEFVYQNTFRLNRDLYSSLGEKRAFVLSHGKNMLAFKIVGYAEQVLQYYRMEDLLAHVWISHQRYPTKGKIWHPGGAHPFIGLHEALVHNGDFANYYGVCEYLRQRNIRPLFLTDTEVSVLLFDLWSRVYRYPLEYVIEALAPTTERDFLMLPNDRQQAYKAIQISHLHGSPDGPWFFIIARNDPYQHRLQLIGITDTSMLRPQVFALHEGEVQIGVIASEKQAIDAVLRSLSQEDPRICPVADKYWNARGGSHTDGGAFIFSLEGGHLTCTNKFGKAVLAPSRNPLDSKSKKRQLEKTRLGNPPKLLPALANRIFDLRSREAFNFRELITEIAEWDDTQFCSFLDEVVTYSCSRPEFLCYSIKLLTLFHDWRFPQPLERKWFLALLEEALDKVFASIPELGSPILFNRVDWPMKGALRPPKSREQTLVVDAHSFPSEGDESLANFLVKAYQEGWQRFILYRCRGQRFIGCGLGPSTFGVQIDVYGSSGDYLGSGLDGAKVYVHGSGQDQLGQILKQGRLVIYGDVGQTFMYGAKGGEAYVLGNAAGRPLINAVGSPRVVINGTALDYLAESFMAGDPLKGGGFVIINGIELDEEGKIQELETPYPGGNLFSLASGGAIYIRDPGFEVDEDQLNGGIFAPLTEADWDLILPYLRENEDLFGIAVEELLRVKGKIQEPKAVYRKVKAVKKKVLS